MPASPKTVGKAPAGAKKAKPSPPASGKKPAKPKASVSASTGEKPRTTPAHGCRHICRVDSLRMPKDLMCLAAGLLLAVIVFSSGLGGGLVFDDNLAITKNADADARTPIANVFVNDFWGHHLRSIVSNRSYRPLIVLSFRLQHLLMGYRHSALFLHAVNYAAAYVNACLVFYLARVYALIMFRGRRATTGGTQSTQLYTLPAFAMALFIVHPVHVDAVTSIVGRCEVFYCLFGLLAFFTAHRYLAGHDGTARKAALLLLIAALMVLCVLSKDSGITFAALLIVHAATLLHVDATSKRAAATMTIFSVAMIVGYFVFRQRFIGSLDLRNSPVLRRTETPQLFVPSGRWNWWAIRWVIQMKNLELLFFPTSLCCEYSYNCIPQLSSPSDPRVIPFICVTVALAAFTAALLFFTFARRNVVALSLLVSLLWLAIPYAPVSHLFVQIGTFVAERCLYVPSIGAVLFMVFLFVKRGDDVASQSLSMRYVPLLVLLMLWAGLSMSQNSVWKDAITLFRSAVDTCPNSGKARAQLATAMVERDGTIYSEAETLFKEAYAIDDRLSEVLYYLAVDAWQNKHDSDTAYELIRKCAGVPLSMTKCYPVMHEMRSHLFPDKKQYELALDDMSIARRNPDIAGKYREAAELVIRDEKDYCYARTLLFAAMKYWSFSSLMWRTDDIGPAHTDRGTYCEAAGRAAQAAEQCYLVQRPAEFAERDNPHAKLFKHGRIIRTLTRITDGLRNCHTNWTRADVLKANTTVFDTYPTQVARFVPLATTTIDAFTAIYETGFVEASAERKASAMALILEAALRRYCAAATLSEDTAVTRKLKQLAPEEMKRVQATFKVESSVWLKQIKSSLDALHLLAPGSEQTRSLVETFTSCVPGLAE